MTDLTEAKRRLQEASARLAIARDNKRRTEAADDQAAAALARASDEWRAAVDAASVQVPA